MSIAAVGTLLLSTPHTTRAAEGDTDSVRPELEEVIVTARRRAELLQATPLAVTALSQSALNQHHIETVLDLAQLVPSLSSYATQSDANGHDAAAPRLRGLPGAVVYLAEVPFANADYDNAIGLQHGLSEGNLYDLADIEILKGPQGTLFGKNSIGGLIAYQPQRPRRTFGGHVTVSLGNYGDRYTDFAINIPLNSDKLELRVAGQAEQRDGYTHEITQNIYLDDKNYYAFRIGLSFTPNNDFDSYFMYDDYYQHSKGSSVVFSNLNPNSFINYLYPGLVDYFAIQKSLGKRSVVGDNFQHLGRDHFYGLTNITTWRLSNTITIKNIIALRVVKQLPTTDYTLIGPPNQILYVGDPLGNSKLSNDSTQYTEEIQLQGISFGSRLHWSAGGFFEYDKPNSDTLLAAATLANTFIGENSFYHYHIVDRSRAIFISGDYDFSRYIAGLKISAGYRYTWDSNLTSALGTTGVDMVVRDLAGRPINCTGLFLTDNNCFQRPPESRFGSGSWNFSVSEQFRPNLFVYLRSGNAYRPGGINLNVPAQYAAFAPEHATDVELGVKANWMALGRSGRVNADIFHTFYNDIQVQGPVPVTDPQGKLRVETLESNAARATLDGGELEAAVSPFSGLELSAHGSYLTSHYDEFPTTLSPAGNKTPFLYSPKFSYGASINLRVPFSASIGYPHISIDYSWYGSQYASTDPAQPSARLPSHELTNARVNWENVGGRPYDVSFWVTNAFDVTYATGSIPLYTQLGFTSLTYNSPRMFGVTLTRRFGVD